MALRASWKGVLKVAELSCPVALFTAVSTSERIAFHTPIAYLTGNHHLLLIVIDRLSYLAQSIIGIPQVA